MLRLLRSILICCAAAFVTSLSGCIPYPVYKTLQPAAALTVLDESSQPVADARVVLIAAAYPYGFDRFRTEKHTASDGRAQFDSRHEWRTEVLAIHGSEVFFWNWCVEKPGYETYATHDGSADKFDDNLVIRLKRGESRSCNSTRESPFMRGENPAADKARSGSTAPAGNRPAADDAPGRATDSRSTAVKP
ncbi:carboxypeptidase regulatory-like domain-containing protein [Achromobacter sp. UMC71]|uniref:carboxypeptidase regulatory-like domain-containing protein n=1 Tax=Achromobacter sp. UMC71 TaxID=1862320 RepID=UPI001603963A|nr:carboxypeptidase regulatory-like domain-containing protein [Achromobacter sp. UMC71]MBB1624209.1 hypothetical protein [Achromobacter sp. UMC71]